MSQKPKSAKILDKPFQAVIQSLYGVKLEKFDLGAAQNKKILRLIERAAGDVCAAVQASPIERSGPSAVGNDIEPYVIDALKKRGLKAGRPKTKSGRGQSMGYPDIRIETDGLPIYLEVKTYAAATSKTAQRSFYLSPSSDPKVFEDGRHLAVGFEIKRAGNLFTPVAFKIADLFGLKCDLKQEYNSDNKRLYESGRVLAKKQMRPA